MKKMLLLSVGTALLQLASVEMSVAAKYYLCISCSAGGPYLVGSPTPNPGGSYQSSICASNGAGAPVSMTLAPVLRGKHVCFAKAVINNDLKAIEK
jgi:hypothetical protein